MWWMNFIAYTALFGEIASLWNKKMRLWVNGAKILRKGFQVIRPKDEVIWFHAASYGEFEEGKPLIERFRKEHPKFKIINLFSPSGYEGTKITLLSMGFLFTTDITSHVKDFWML